MDWLQALGGLIVGSGGLVGLLNYFRVRQSRKKGMPQNEQHARRIADQSSLNRYWQGELAQARQDRKDEMTDLRGQIRNLQQALQEQTLSDAERIDQLEEWIWLKKPPPPPPKKKNMRDKQ